MGVHVVFGAKAGFDAAQIASITHGSPDDPCWSDPAERTLLRAVDQLHDDSTVDDPTWSALAADLRPDQLLDIVILAGWYHAISYAANAAQVDLEPGAPRFADYT